MSTESILMIILSCVMGGFGLVLIWVCNHLSDELEASIESDKKLLACLTIMDKLLYKEKEAIA